MFSAEMKNPFWILESNLRFSQKNQPMSFKLCFNRKDHTEFYIKSEILVAYNLTLVLYMILNRRPRNSGQNESPGNICCHSSEIDVH